MQNVRRWPWIVGGVVTGAAAIALLVEALTSKKAKRVALIGDSLAVGLGPQLAKLAAAANVPFIYDATGGTTPLQWSKHAAACSDCGDKVLAFEPTEVLVALGANDIGYSPAPPVGPYQAVRDKFAAGGARIIWLDVPLSCCTTCNLDGIRSVVHSLGVTVVPATNTIPVGPRDPKTGFAHPSPAGYAEWAKIVWSYT